MVLAAPFGPIGRVGAGVVSPAQGPGLGAVDGTSRPVDAVGVLEFFEEDFMQTLPDAGLLPGLEVLLERAATTPTQLGGDFFPGDTRLQDEDDARHHLTEVERLATGKAPATALAGWPQRFETFPERVTDQGLGHDGSSSLPTPPRSAAGVPKKSVFPVSLNTV